MINMSLNNQTITITPTITTINIIIQLILINHNSRKKYLMNLTNSILTVPLLVRNKKERKEKTYM